jgi:hypothetical protein
MQPRMKYYTHIIASRRRQETRRAGQVKRLLAGGKGEKKAGLSLHSSLDRQDVLCLSLGELKRMIMHSRFPTVASNNLNILRHTPYTRSFLYYNV